MALSINPLRGTVQPDTLQWCGIEAPLRATIPMTEISLGPSSWCISHRVACLCCFLLIVISSESCCGRSVLVEQLEGLPPLRIRVFILILMRCL
jgi:hypothetical protein